MPRVIHFEIHADDPDRAVRFYQTVFAWEFTRYGGPMDYRLIKTGPDGEPGINPAIGVFTVRTGHGALRTTCSATLPISNLPSPVRPCVPRTITSHACARARRTISSAALPSRSTRSTGTAGSGGTTRRKRS